AAPPDAPGAGGAAAHLRRGGRRPRAGHDGALRGTGRARAPAGRDAMTVLASSWTDASSLGYPVLFGGVLLGSIVPVIPTGAVVGAAAAVALTTHDLSLPLVMLVATLGAFLGDVVTFTLCRFGGPSAVRWVARGQHVERI